MFRKSNRFGYKILIQFKRLRSPEYYGVLYETILKNCVLNLWEPLCSALGGDAY